MNAISPTKTPKCGECKAPYVKRNTWQTLCGSADCAIAKANKSKAKRERLDRAETKVKLEAMAKKPELTKKAQEAFNAFIRARDYGKPCISCGKPLAWGTGATGGVCDAGHWLSVGARINLRFNEDNCHAQCKHCNNQLSGNAANYRIGLVERIGLERVEILERDHCLRKYTREGLREIAKQYKQMTKELQA
jgi:hypothetical protein